MKKTLVIVLAVVMALSVVAFAACGGGETVEGEYSYDNAWTPGQKYGCKVSVTVKDGIITKVTVEADTATFYNLSEGWKDKESGEDTAGKKAWIANGQKMAESFVGLKVEDVNKIKVTCDKTGAPDTKTEGVQTIADAPSALKVVASATQSSGRLILAVQNALSKLGK